VIDGVVAEQRVERLVREGERLVGVGHAELDAAVPGGRGEPVGGGADRRRVDVHADDGDAEPLGHAHRRASRSARDLQHPLVRAEPEPLAELVALGGRDPARLPEVLAERLDADGPVDLGLHVSVVTVVQIGRGHAGEAQPRGGAT
jgi:hypothetical protein